MLLHKPSRIFFILSGIVLMLLVLHLTSFHFQEAEELNTFFLQTNFNAEKNIPSTFSSLLHLFASLSLALVGISRLNINTSKAFWFFLSFIFLFLSLDELLRIHEKITGPLTGLMAETGTFIYSWTLYYGIGLLILGVLVLKPLIALPDKTRNQFIIAGGIFIFGAIGMENLAGRHIHENNIAPADIITHPDIFILSTIEETMEMMGVIFFIYAVLRFRVKYQTREVHSQS
jgi:hypothetical protein